MAIMREDIINAYNGYCGNCYSHTKDGELRAETCLKKAIDIHHILHNTNTNRKLYPLLIDSPFIKIPLCRYCHDHYSLYPHIARLDDKRAALWEAWLREFKKHEMC